MRYFCTDQSAARASRSTALAPVAAAGGPVAFTIDWEAVEWLWSLDGYPSDPRYADFHRKSLRGAPPVVDRRRALRPEPRPRRAPASRRREFVAAVAERARALRRRARPPRA